MECVDRALKDICASEDLFGGIPILFSGNFRQILPILPHGNVISQAEACLKRSYIWAAVQKFSLKTNVRLLGTALMDPEETAWNCNFSKWLLKLGSGQLQDLQYANVSVDHCLFTRVCPPVSFDENFVQTIYDQVNTLVSQKNWLALENYYEERCLITPLTKTVDHINRFLMGETAGDLHVSHSIDRMDEDFPEQVLIEVLNTFLINGFPGHTLSLKVGMQLFSSAI